MMVRDMIHLCTDIMNFDFHTRDMMDVFNNEILTGDYDLETLYTMDLYCDNTLSVNYDWKVKLENLLLDMETAPNDAKEYIALMNILSKNENEINKFKKLVKMKINGFSRTHNCWSIIKINFRLLKNDIRCVLNS